MEATKEISPPSIQTIADELTQGYESLRQDADDGINQDNALTQVVSSLLYLKSLFTEWTGLDMFSWSLFGKKGVIEGKLPVAQEDIVDDQRGRFQVEVVKRYLKELREDRSFGGPRWEHVVALLPSDLREYCRSKRDEILTYHNEGLVAASAYVHYFLMKQVSQQRQPNSLICAVLTCSQRRRTGKTSFQSEASCNCRGQGFLFRFRKTHLFLQLRLELR